MDYQTPQERWDAKLEWQAAMAGFLKDYFPLGPGLNRPHFLTVTFRTPREAHHAGSTLLQVSKVLRRVGGYSRGFLGTELHASRALHLHGLVGDRRSWVTANPTVVNGALRAAFGISEVRAVRQISAVTNYCTKYVTKDLTDYYIW